MTKQTTAEEFIKAWVTSDSINEVADKLGLGVQSVKLRAKSWREKGVKLPKKTAETNRGLNVAELNKMLEEYK